LHLKQNKNNACIKTQTKLNNRFIGFENARECMQSWKPNQNPNMQTRDKTEVSAN